MLRFLGAVFLTAIVAAAGAFGAWYYHDSQARKFLAAATPAIYTTWNADAFMNRSLAKALSEEEMTRDVPRMFYFMNQALGPLQSSSHSRESCVMAGATSPCRAGSSGAIPRSRASSATRRA
jgi:hypothetical protein